MKRNRTIHELLYENRQIAAIWAVEDVQAVRPDLDADQAWKVLQEIDRLWMAEYGITWDTLRDTAEGLFGPPPSPC